MSSTSQTTASTVRHIYLMRHAKSGWDDPALADIDRPLSPRGERAGAVMCAHMRELGIRPELIICSVAVRTRQTLELIRPAFTPSTQVRYERAIYEAAPHHLLTVLNELPASVGAVMMIGHNPGTQQLAEGLTGRGDSDAMERLRRKYPTAGLTTLSCQLDDWQSLGPSCCELHNFVTPRDLD